MITGWGKHADKMRLRKTCARLVYCLQILDMTTAMICRTTSEHSFNRVEFASLLTIWYPMRLSLDAGKRTVLMLSHNVSFGSECCRPVTVFESCGNSGECADVLLNRRAASKEAQYDALSKSQQERVDGAVTREWVKWNECGITKFMS